MPRPKGTPKTGGRKKGTPNKTTAEFKRKIGDIVFRNLEVIESELNKEDKKEIDFNQVGVSLAITKALTGYVVPKQTEQKISIDEESLSAVKESIDKMNELFK